MMNIPGTNIPLKTYERKCPRLISFNAMELRQRRALLAKVHIAKKEMGLNEGEYEMILKGFKVCTAADMTIPQLENMVKLLKHYGWKPMRSRRKADPNREDRLEALRRRVIEEANGLENWEKRLAGLIESICGVKTLRWVRNADKLKRLLAVIGKIKENEYERQERQDH